MRSPAGTGLPASLPCGDPDPTRPGRLPAGRAATWTPPASRALRVPSGWPAAPLDPAAVQSARRHPSPGAGEEQRPTSRQEVVTVTAQEWTRTEGTTNAPSAQAEADVHELGRRVAQHFGYQQVLTDDPAEYA